MAKKALKNEAVTSVNKWNSATGKVMVSASGKPLRFEEDSDCILRFVSIKDISDKVKKLKDGEEAVYLIFEDGKTRVAVSRSYALNECSFLPGKYYYIHCAATIPNKSNPMFNDMKDFEIVELGGEGETVESGNPELTGSDTLLLSLGTIAELNYKAFNYPLRPEPKVNKQL